MSRLRGLFESSPGGGPTISGTWRVVDISRPHPFGAYVLDLREDGSLAWQAHVPAELVEPEPDALHQLAQQPPLLDGAVPVGESEPVAVIAPMAASVRSTISMTVATRSIICMHG